jgi:hypothetical protein
MSYHYPKNPGSHRRHPGAGFNPVICDLCGLKRLARDTQKVHDKYNLLNNMVICILCTEETNPQQHLRAVMERQISLPEYIRPEGPDKAVQATNTRLAGPPKNLTIIEATDALVSFQWFGPDDSGSSAPIGYSIEVESPIGGGFSVLTETSPSVSMKYSDATVNPNTEYNYRVAVINNAGVGAYSDPLTVTTAV